MPTLSTAAWALRAQFFVSGAWFATWGVHVPTVKAHFALGEQALGLAMLASGVGALLALVQAGRLVGRFGRRAVSMATGLAGGLLLAGLVAFDSYGALLALLLAFGIAVSLFDVAINAEATEIERLAGRSLMSGFHGMFSLGGMVGAAAGSALMAPGAGLSAQQHLLGAALVGFALLAVGWLGMLPRQAPAAEGGGHASLSLPRGPLWLIGLLAAMGLMAEGALYDWSVLYMRQALRSEAGTAALAYASFSAAMAAGRFGGDAIRARIASVPLLGGSGGLAAAGMALALMASQPGVALAGFALVGLGLANIVPVLFSAAAKVPGVAPTDGIAAVASLGYAGMMVGPPVIGFIAESSSLAAGLSTVVLFAVCFALAARRALPAGA